MVARALKNAPRSLTLSFTPLAFILCSLAIPFCSFAEPSKPLATQSAQVVQVADANAPVDLRIETSLPAWRPVHSNRRMSSDEQTLFVSNRGVGERDRFAVHFSRAIKLDRLEVATGRDDGTSKLTSGVLEVSLDGVDYVDAAPFVSGQAKVQLQSRAFRAIRIRPTAPQEARLVIRGVTFEPQATVQSVIQGISIDLDASAAPDLEQWGRRAGQTCQDWFPKIVSSLPSEGFEPPTSVRVVFAKSLGKGIGFAEGTQITLSAPYVRAHPEDVSLVIHELTHVVQAYKGGLRKPPVWLVEGIADYVRYFEYPGIAPSRRINPRTASYRDSYQTSASFLNWIQRQHDPLFVQKINASIRQGNFKEALFQQFTGETLDELWKEFAATLSGNTQA